MDTSDLSKLKQARGPFATAFVDVGHGTENGEHEHGLRVRAAVDQLREQGADDAVVDVVTRSLMETADQPAPVARLVVANADGIVLEEVAAVQVDQPVATWGPLPDLARWVEHRDATVSFVLAVVDHTGGDVAVHVSDVPTALEEQSIEVEDDRAAEINKVTVGGWAQKHYELRTENAWRESADEVVDAITSYVRAGHHLVLLAGDPTSKGMVREKLGSTQAEVVELSSGQRAEDGGDEALQQAIREALMEQVVQRRLGAVHELRERLGRGEAVASGIDDVADAFVRGQVDTLLLDPTRAAETELDPSRYEGLVLGDGVPQQPLRADQALVAAAVLTDAAVTVAPYQAMGGEPVAALLRWDQPTPGSQDA
ncbi:baeRF2 domain-containing protein [Nocardioides abyssi]|uniref:Vms1/Ankzf1 family peptidyl-tRNA hydrolase n=1 Tax=Nocardioides abyssi TaxID=3058370 RepID=A0ABT8EUK1_9ACTN|nr:Vms1/Ankzf1 family peptidyl-tRNA hydrolase [Nocardioides abyssi]MDN4161845.1 Vms1/Ankzf1 family peptidyl-tRNA hydrolase [Nocardioides abyssi]